MLSWIEWMIFGNHFKPQETELHSVFLRHFYVSPYWTDWPFMFPASLPVLLHGQLLTRPCASNWYVNRAIFDIFPWYEFRRFMAFTDCQCPSPWRGNVQFLPISSVFFSLWFPVLLYSFCSFSCIMALKFLTVSIASDCPLAVSSQPFCCWACIHSEPLSLPSTTAILLSCCIVKNI